MAKQSRNRQRGKDIEKAVAKRFNGQRIGLFGGEDIMHTKFSIEVKSRKKFIGRKWMKQCIDNAPHDKVPIVVVHESHKPHYKDMVIISVDDFLRVEGARK